MENNSLKRKFDNNGIKRNLKNTPYMCLAKGNMIYKYLG